MDNNGLKKLAELARLDISSDNMDKLRTDMEGILGYISKIQEISDADIKELGDVNEARLREDSFSHETGFYSKRLLAEAPKTQNGFVQVKKIIG